jgi:hypothetical protein
LTHNFQEYGIFITQREQPSKNDSQEHHSKPKVKNQTIEWIFKSMNQDDPSKCDFSKASHKTKVHEISE